jgi:hypothetical protein
MEKELPHVGVNGCLTTNFQNSNLKAQQQKWKADYEIWGGTECCLLSSLPLHPLKVMVPGQNDTISSLKTKLLSMLGLLPCNILYASLLQPAFLVPRTSTSIFHTSLFVSTLPMDAKASST